ncbi:MAG: ABC transporter permease [Planctomycetaceae bacterium]|nr:ABC transporter permease [Phycisphaerales bacterium]MCE2652397.1 ABC transporter permease [Planctomycetaceae bacterium]
MGAPRFVLWSGAGAPPEREAGPVGGKGGWESESSGGFRRLVKAVLRSQEFGLLMVIAAIIIGLTTYSHLKNGPITQRTFTDQPAGTVATDKPDGSGFSIEHDGRRTEFLAADGFSYRSTPDKVILIRAFETNRFLNAANMLSVLTAASFIAIMAVGMTGIIVMGGIDLSVGSIYALAAVLGALVLRAVESAMPGSSWLVTVPIGLAVCVGVGALCGLINGSATVGLKVHPFIITLGGMAVYRGIAFVSTEGQSIGSFPESFVKGFFRAEMFGITPLPMLVMLVVAVVGLIVLSMTVFGRHTYAIGGNETAARYAGVPVGRRKIMLFTLCGALAGLSAAVYLGYYGAGSSDAGKGYELSVIAATVVGGASLSGGRGSALGAVLGAIVIQLIDNSILVLGIDQNYKEIVIGLAIVLAVVVDQAKQRWTAKGGKR